MISFSLWTNYPTYSTKFGHAICARRELPRTANPIIQASSKSRILIAGQAPGAITDLKSRPFDDPSGNRLRNWLNVSKEQFYDSEKFRNRTDGFLLSR